MKEIKGHTGPVWAIAHNDTDTFHPMKVDVGQVLSTGQIFLEQFETEESMVERLIELAGDDSSWRRPPLVHEDEE
jgi:hypothetical protein